MREVKGTEKHDADRCGARDDDRGDKEKKDWYYCFSRASRKSKSVSDAEQERRADHGATKYETEMLRYEQIKRHRGIFISPRGQNPAENLSFLSPHNSVSTQHANTCTFSNLPAPLF